MPAKKEYTPEFKEQAVRFVLEEMEPDESRKHACDRLAPRLSVKAVTLYNWVKQSAPAKARPTHSPGSVEEPQPRCDPTDRRPCRTRSARTSHPAQAEPLAWPAPTRFRPREDASRPR
ncbi:MAG: transposase [Acidimicrobiia bacterium]